MTVYGTTSMAVSHGLIWLGAALAIPALAILAYRGWARGVREQVARWRSTLGVMSIAFTFLGWIGLVVPFIFGLMGFNVDFVGSTWITALFYFGVIAISLAFALRGTSRVQALLAGLLVLALWFAGINI